MHDHFMHVALEEAERALHENEVPIGAAIVHNGRVIARAHNQREQLHDPTAHAEMIAITQAAHELQSWRLDGCTLYVTLEPCSMCVGAMIHARIERLVFAAFDPKTGAVSSVFRTLDDPRHNHSITWEGGVLANESSALLKAFFQARRL